MPRPKITLYFDLHSPFAYLAFHTLRVRAEGGLEYRIYWKTRSGNKEHTYLHLDVLVSG
jgi:hypothetical protein